MRTIKLICVCASALLLNATLTAQPKPWVVPEASKSMKNPIATSDASVKAGSAIFSKNCASCHGKTGLGDGVKARSLKTPTGDFTKAEFKNQTDGELFYKTKNGRGDMPKYEGKLTDDDIWNTINYMRTFAAAK
jgi:mono/diheme cytochrome c family protein